jgi:CHAD domain-containing protein
LQSYAAWQVDKAWERLCANDTSLTAMSDKRRHRFRLRIKQFRYVLDFLRSLHHGAKKERKAFRASIGGLQDNLGLLNDLNMAERMAERDGYSIGAATSLHSRAELLDKAEKNLAGLVETGPYWRM